MGIETDSVCVCVCVCVHIWVGNTTCADTVYGGQRVSCMPSHASKGNDGPFCVSVCLCVHIQGQANKWVKNMEGKNGLKVLNLQMSDMARQIENAIQFGNPVLLQVC